MSAKRKTTTKRKTATKKKAVPKVGIESKHVFDFHEFGITLAKLEFEQWKHWAGQILEKESISEERAARWKKLFATPWEDLAPEIQSKDSLWASRIIGVLEEDPFANLVLIGNYLLAAMSADHQYLAENKLEEFVVAFNDLTSTILTHMKEEQA